MKKIFRRHRKRLLTEFSADGLRFNGIATNLSEKGLFIKTQRPFRIGVVLDIKIYLPEEKTFNSKGIVRYVRNSILLKHLNGMGIELLEKDSNYLDFLNTFK